MFFMQFLVGPNLWSGEWHDGAYTPPQGYYRSAHALARIARQMSRQLWRPATESDGIPLDVLVNLVSLLNEWRDEHLQRVGVPSNFAAEWDFVSAVSASGHTQTYKINCALNPAVRVVLPSEPFPFSRA